MRTVVYISGKVSGEPYNKVYSKFDYYEKIVKTIGLGCVNPLKLGIDNDATWEDAMSICLHAQQTRCNAILLLHDWTESKGARIEFERAVTLGHRIYFYDKLKQLQFDVEHKMIYL